MKEGVTCSVRKQPASSVALDISVPASLSQQVHAKVVEELAKGASVDGFRKGKVPVSAIMAKIGMTKIKVATVEQLIDVGMQQGGSQVQIPTLGQARLDGEVEDLAAEYKLGEALDFTVLVDVYPEVALDAEVYKSLVVKVEKTEFDQEAYEASLLKLRDQNIELARRLPGGHRRSDGRLPAARQHGRLPRQQGRLARRSASCGRRG
jgi:trigger factor